MTTDYIVISFGIVVTLLGYFTRPGGVGWFLIGFGTAWMISGILLLIRDNRATRQSGKP
ncbi:hypothetical protein EDC14_10471 [Hydrogenispora ethanolica]|uniref:Uncharacterized protein n=1 Tax=Hydrogenispora ethanolica TaxID=1082276 RepID=A0A4R1QTC3_HYDET|nr:hypothetical protein [Hydrogenispora ethanolica]TCL57098.1 hypothetical protein EDC14_10471 [Hydrogenispora ethanolica]